MTDPKHTKEQIEHFRHILFNTIPICYQECCVFREYEKRMKKELRKLMKEAQEDDTVNARVETPPS